MALDRGGDAADVLGLIVGARDPELIHIDVEASALADAKAPSDPDARAHPPGDHRRDGHALCRIAEEGHLDPLGVVEIRNEAKPAALADVIHDQPRRLLALFGTGGATASE